MRKILVVDNDRFFLEVIKDLLQQEGHEVLTAEDGLSALDILEGFTPDIIFLDMVMPNIDGKRLCRILRNMKDFRDTTIVSLSATALEDSADILRSGVDASIAKGPLNELAVNILSVIDKEMDSVSELFPETIGEPGKIRARGITRELLSIMRHFEIILGQIDEGIFELAQRGRVVYANPGAALLMHSSEEDMLGRPFLDLFGEENRKRVRVLIEGDAERSNQALDAPPLILNGHQVLMDIHPIPDSERKLIVILRDITKQKRVEEALNRSEALYRLLFENASDPLFIFQDGLMRLSNKRISEMLGFTPTHLLDLPFADIVHPQDRHAVAEKCRRIQAGDERWGLFSFRMLNRSQEVLRVEVKAFSIQWNGRPAILHFIKNTAEKTPAILHFIKNTAEKTLPGTDSPPGVPRS